MNKDSTTLTHKCIELEEFLCKHSKLYYKQTPEISDELFDKKFVEFRELARNIGYTSDLLTNVGSDLTGDLEKVQHLRPMISIRTEVDTSERPITEFTARCEKLLGANDIVYVTEPKYDGLAISLRYTARGILTHAVTRGNCEVGEDVTRSVRLIPNICSHLPESFKYTEIRGELVLLKDNFDKANEIRVKNKEKPFVNCRNAIAGIIRKKTPDAELLALTHFIPYSCFGKSADDSQYTNLINLQKLFVGADKVHRDAGYKGTAVSLYGNYKDIEAIRSELPFEIDGVVYKVDSMALQEKMGITGREPRWSIAHKLPAEIACTVLSNIDIQVGPSGRLTPVARLPGIFVGGTTVRNVTLSNIFQIRNKGVRIGDNVLLQRAGDVIPEIIGVSKDNERLTYVPNFRMPKTCPVCGGVVQRKHGESNHYCIESFTCPAQASGMLARACSEGLLDIDGFGSKIAESMVDVDKTQVYQIFDLTMEDMMELDVGQANGQKLLAKIHQVKVTPIGFDMFLRLIGVAELGASASKKIAGYIGNFTDFLKFNPDELKPLGVNSRVIANIKQFQKNDVAIEMAFRLHQRLTIVNYEKNVDGILAGKTLVVTGSAPGISREGLKKKLEVLGAKIAGSVSKSTSIVIYGEGAGDKLERARSLGIETVTYEEFMNQYNITI